MSQKLLATRLHDSGFLFSDSNFNSLTVLDGRVYYTLSSHAIDHSGRVYRYDPAQDRTALLCDLGEATGDTGCIPHGKSHSPFSLLDGKLIFATHFGFYQGSNGKEEPAPPPEGYRAYPGGTILSLDPAAGKASVLARAPEGEGILTMTVDAPRRRAFCLTWPRGYLLLCDLSSGRMVNLGQHCRGGELGQGDRYSCLSRIFAVDPRDGLAYLSVSDGTVLRIDFEKESAEPLELSLKRDFFGELDPSVGGHNGYNWRYLYWSPAYQTFFCTHGRSGYLYAFDPRREKITLYDRLVSDYCLENGKNPDFHYGYMCLLPDPVDPGRLYHLTGYQEDGHVRMAMLSYDIPSRTRIQHGILALDSGRDIENTQTLGLGPDGRFYTCGWYKDGRKKPDGTDHTSSDLMSFSL